MMIKVSSTYPDTEGKVGGDVYRHDQCLNHIQKMPREVEHGETPQQKAFSRCINAWKSHVWNTEELNRWWLWSSKHPQKGRKGDISYLTPFMAFMKVNVKRVLHNMPIIWMPNEAIVPTYGCTISGAIDPPINGYYKEDIWFNKHRTYYCPETSWWLWFHAGYNWLISPGLEVFGIAYWVHEPRTVQGSYTPRYTASGIASVVFSSSE
jgi:hypothetical protein